MNDVYITVAEFAKKANISKQRVYQLLNKRLKEFVQEVDNKKMIDIKALELFGIQEGCSNIQGDCSILEQEVEAVKKRCKIAESQEPSALELLKTTVEMLKQQLEEKDRTIRELTEALKNEQLQTSQAQALHSGSIKQLLEQGVNPRGTQEEAVKEQQKKEAADPKGFFKRLFKR